MKPPAYSFGLIGYPVDHSLSPVIHHAALRALELPGEYHLYAVKPLPEGATHLAELLGKMRQGEIHGLNVTIPHKQSVIPLVENLTPVASAIGAVNTIFYRDECIHADNTDAPSFIATLQQHLAVFPDKKAALILGAGGAARAVVYALIQAGWRITLAARRIEQALDLIAHYSRQDANNTQINAIHFSQITDFTCQNEIQLIVNTTPLGMAPQQNTTPWPMGVPFPEGAFVYDLVYNPAETIFLQAARAQRLRATNGLNMLVEQAALAFERWTGVEAPRQAMQQAVFEYIAANWSTTR